MTNKTTAIGTVQFASLDKPSFKFKKEGEFVVVLELSAEDAQAFAGEFQEAKEDLAKELLAKKKKRYNVSQLIKEVDGVTTITFNSPTQPKFFDSRGNPITKALKIGKGSRIKVNVKAYDAGLNDTTGIFLKMFMNSVQVVDLVEYGGDNPFEAVEGGFVASEDKFVDSNTVDEDDLY